MYARLQDCWYPLLVLLFCVVDYSAYGENFHTCSRKQIAEPLSKNIPKTAKIQLDGGCHLLFEEYL